MEDKDFQNDIPKNLSGKRFTYKKQWILLITIVSIIFGLLIILYFGFGQFKNMIPFLNENEEELQVDNEYNKNLSDIESNIMRIQADRDSQEPEPIIMPDYEPEEEESIIDLSDIQIPTGEDFTPQAKQPSQAEIDRTARTFSDDEAEDLEITTKARMNIVNPDYLLSENTVIKCTLLNNVVSTINNKVRCLVNNNVYSKNGKNILIKSGSIAKGISAGGLVRGQNKMFIVWQSIETPDGVKISLEDAQSVDKLGEAGHKARVNNNYFGRFSNAIVVSLLSSGITSVRSKAMGKYEDLDLSHFQGSAEDSLDNMRNLSDLQAVGAIDRGIIVNIMVSRDIDFSEVPTY